MAIPLLRAGCCQQPFYSGQLHLLGHLQYPLYNLPPGLIWACQPLPHFSHLQINLSSSSSMTPNFFNSVFENLLGYFLIYPSSLRVDNFSISSMFLPDAELIFLLKLSQSVNYKAMEV